MAPMIQIKDLSFSYRDKSVLKDISMSIYGGETWSIIGKNGAGKSTLVKCMAGLLPVTQECVFINGKDITRLKPRDVAKEIAYVPQAATPGFAPYTVFDFVMLGRFPYQGLMAIPRQDDRRIVRDALRLADMEHLESRQLFSLSGGELQRAFLAGAVAQQSKILLLDEPSSFLDPLHQELMHQSLKRIHDEYGTVIITITHDANSAISQYDNIAALNEGRLFFAGTTSDFKIRCPSILEEIFSIRFERAQCVSSQRSIIVPGEMA
ncbi:MAG TPA: ABC transporter ATP-binding protein [Chitinivibrionales bacterium]|nr:ABC transporter ATP-binding protein [Chitinivibrionales bacterium]